MPIQINPNRIKIKNGASTQGVQVLTDSELNITSNDYLTPEQFGARGDGATNDKTKIQDAINAAAQYNPPKPIVFKNTYFIGFEDNDNSDQIIIPSNSKLIFEHGSKLITNYSYRGNDDISGVFRGFGTAQENYQLLPNDCIDSTGSYVKLGAQQNNNYDNYSPGDYIELFHYQAYPEDEEQGENNNPPPIYVRIGIYQITRKYKYYNSLFLSHKIPILEGLYPTHIKKISTSDNIEIIGDNTQFTNNYGTLGKGGNFFNFNYCSNLKISGIHFISNGSRAINLRHSFNSIIKQCKWEALGINKDEYYSDNDSTTASSIGYDEKEYINLNPPQYQGFIDVQGTGTIFDNCIATNCVSGFDFAGSKYSMANNCYCYNAKIRTHGLGAYQISFNNCYVFIQGTNNTSCATFGNLSSGNSYQRRTYMKDSYIYCNNCYFYNGIWGIILENKTTNVFLNNCRIEGSNILIKGAGVWGKGNEDYITQISDDYQIHWKCNTDGFSGQSHGGKLYINMCSGKLNANYLNARLCSGYFSQIIVNGVISLDNSFDLIEEIIMPKILDQTTNE